MLLLKEALLFVVTIFFWGLHVWKNEQTEYIFCCRATTTRRFRWHGKLGQRRFWKAHASTGERSVIQFSWRKRRSAFFRTTRELRSSLTGGVFRLHLRRTGRKKIAPGSTVLHQPDILDSLLYVANENELPANDIPVPASGVGYLSYEFCTLCDTISLAPQKDELNIPESEFVVGHIYIVFDHFTEMMHIFALNYTEHQIDLQKAVDSLKSRLTDLDFSYLAPPEEPKPCRTLTDLAQSEREYKEKVSALKKHIVAGDIFQAVPSRRLQLECDSGALEIYRRLRSVNPSPYLVYIDFGDRQLLGSSPESLVRVRDGVASIRPIAGTRRRGKNAAEDERLKADLLGDKKEISEHLMLVDLARNDLGRVCKSGSVEVTRYMDCEYFSHVMHLVSDVQGKVKDGLKQIQVLRSAFPAGTVSGSPKISAIEILSRLESVKRRFYAGAIGYLEASGDLDFCIGIRCALKQGAVWTLQAGGDAGVSNQRGRQRIFIRHTPGKIRNFRR